MYVPFCKSVDDVTIRLSLKIGPKKAQNAPFTSVFQKKNLGETRETPTPPPHYYERIKTPILDFI